MPELREIHFFTVYILMFFVWALEYDPECLVVLGLWTDIRKGKVDIPILERRETQLLAQAALAQSMLSSYSEHTLRMWVKELKDIADSIPDTHGLMIDAVCQFGNELADVPFIWHSTWKVRMQLPSWLEERLPLPYYHTWVDFCDALLAVKMDHEPRSSGENHNSI